MDRDDDRLVVFQAKSIRRVLVDDEWFFAVVDVVAALTDSVNPADYIKKVRQRDPALAEGGGQIVQYQRQAVHSGLIAPMSRACSASFSPFHRRKRSIEED